MIIGNKPKEEPFHLRICYHRCLDITHHLNKDQIWELEDCDWGTIHIPGRRHTYIEYADLPPSIRKIISDNPIRLMTGEAAMVRDLSGTSPTIRPVELFFYRKRILVAWLSCVETMEDIIKHIDKVGFATEREREALEERLKTPIEVGDYDEPPQGIIPDIYREAKTEMIPTEELTRKLLETLTLEQANQAVEDAIKNRVVAYCYKVPRDEEIRHMYEYVTLDKRLFQLWLKIDFIPKRVN